MVGSGDEEIRFVREHVHVHGRSLLFVLLFSDFNRPEPHGSRCRNRNVEIGRRSRKAALAIRRQNSFGVRPEILVQLRLQSVFGQRE